MTLQIEDRLTMITICMDKAEKALKTALSNAEIYDYDGAANRAYYSIFYCENALLLTKGIQGASHKNVHNAIAKEFIKSGDLPDDTYKKILFVQKIRNTGDYSKESFVSEEDMGKTISAAKDFFSMTQRLITQFKTEQGATNNQQQGQDV